MRRGFSDLRQTGLYDQANFFANLGGPPLALNIGTLVGYVRYLDSCDPEAFRKDHEP